MGDAKRRAEVTNLGVTGEHAGDERMLAATMEANARLLAVVNELLAETGNWGPVLNSIVTLAVNLQLEVVGLAETERVMRAVLRELPKTAAMRQFAMDQKAPAAGRA